MHNYVYNTYGPKNLKRGIHITSTLLSEYTQCRVIGKSTTTDDEKYRGFRECS